MNRADANNAEWRAIVPDFIPIASPSITEAEQRAVAEVLAGGGLAGGPQVAAFEEEFSAIVGGRHCVAVNSGTAALHLGLLALGIGPGDEVIVPSFSFAASANAIALTGATPVFADIDPDTFCLDPSAAAAAITSRTVAVMVVHLYGQMADVTAFSALTRDLGLLLVEDAAQAHAAGWRGRPAGSRGDLAAFSFYPTKNMTSAEGGMIVTPHTEVVRIARLLRNQGMERRYHNEVVGFNARMSDVHAAIGRVQLSRLPGFTADRRRNAAVLTTGLAGIVTVPVIRPGADHVFHQYTVRVPAGLRDALQTGLADRGVGAAVYYPVPIHRLPSFDQQVDLPNTEAAAAEVLSLPVHPALTPADLDRICDAVSETMKELSR